MVDQTKERKPTVAEIYVKEAVSRHGVPVIERYVSRIVVAQVSRRRETHIPLDDIQVDESLNYVERPVAVLDLNKSESLRCSGSIVRVPSGPGNRKLKCESITRSFSTIDFGDEIPISGGELWIS
ncbi:hypothetical protein OSB04_006325 [Centaurea solstitialis]|uniref:Uncharacterized protein n=1 Tax=Centaurea solstitialis TaxID=347529 RepID=A0AA38THQ2_9ASTR|nr:hypothetical protein OSB04_006325 [Centaurea solstitialis]